MTDGSTRRQFASIPKGFVAGFLGGIVGSGAKLLGEAVFPPRRPGETPPPLVLAEEVANHPLSKAEQTGAMQGIHWTFGALTGGVYGALAEVAPFVTAGSGLAFGVTLFLSTHESALPLLGLSDPPSRQPAKEHVSELVTHSLFGASTELVRRLVRNKLKG